jgi:hypothetical protein
VQPQAKTADSDLNLNSTMKMNTGENMKRIASVLLSGMLLLAFTATLASAQTQSLGDYARSVRKDKDDKSPSPSTKKFDNDNLPINDKLSVVGQPPAQTDGATANAAKSTPDDVPTQTASNSVPATDEAAKTQSKGVPTVKEQEKANDDWKNKISSEKDQIDLLTRELDVVQREYRLRAAAMYSDAGNRLRDQGDWDKQDAQYKQQIDDKTKALESAKQKLDDMQESARKDGVPSSMRE